MPSGTDPGQSKRKGMVVDDEMEVTEYGADRYYAKPPDLARL